MATQDFSPSELATRAVIRVLEDALQNRVGVIADSNLDKIFVTASPVDEKYAGKFDGTPAIVVASDFYIPQIFLSGTMERMAMVETRVMILSENLRELSFLSVAVVTALVRNQDLIAHYSDNKLTPTRILVDRNSPRVATATITRPYNAKVVSVFMTAPMILHTTGGTQGIGSVSVAHKLK